MVWTFQHYFHLYGLLSFCLIKNFDGGHFVQTDNLHTVCPRVPLQTAWGGEKRVWQWKAKEVVHKRSRLHSWIQTVKACRKYLSTQTRARKAAVISARVTTPASSREPLKHTHPAGLRFTKTDKMDKNQKEDLKWSFCQIIEREISMKAGGRPGKQLERTSTK